MASNTVPILLRTCRAMGNLSNQLNLRVPKFLSSVNYLNKERKRYYSTEEVKRQQDVKEDPNKKPSPEIENLTNEMNKLKEKNEELLDKYRRSLADSENLRQRLVKQIEDAKVFGIQSFCKDLLEVADILGHATDSVPKDQINSNPHLKSLYEGLIMTRSSLLQVFRRHGLEAVNPINQKFDPNLHEALFQKEDKTVEPNTVVEVSKIGYKLQDRCIRPALVGVSRM